MKKITILLLALLFFQCKEDQSPQPQSENLVEELTFSYADGFAVKQLDNYKVLEIKKPWPDSRKTYRYALVDNEMASQITLDRKAFDGIVVTPVKNIVVTSTTHIPSLELLNVENSLVGFPDINFVSSEKTKALIDKGVVRELGKNESINTEVLLEVAPEVVVGFGIDGNNKTFQNIQKAGIPVIYNGDWVEKSPLAKAEWIKFFGLLYNKEREADSIFKIIERDYLNAKQQAEHTSEKPTILSGGMYKDIWYLPGGASAEAQLLKDAHTDYLWQATIDRGSLALNFEGVFDKAKDADIWISPSSYGSLEALEKANQHYTKFKAYQTGEVYSFVNTTGKTGGVLYFELGTARPDLVLKDLIKIAHPDLFADQPFHFFERLD